MIEKVNPSHPDKIADRIAGAIVDLGYRLDANCKLAVEVLLGHGVCNVIAEGNVAPKRRDIVQIVHRIAGKMRVRFSLVAQDVYLAANQENEIRCGDNGIFRGVPLTAEEKELSRIAHEIYVAYPSDGKYILHQKHLIICQSNVRGELLRTKYDQQGYQTVVNPLGDWTGGTDVDCGATNRKLGSDMGQSVTGGGLHGKDLSKADVSVNIYAFLKAQATGKPVELYCAIGDTQIDGKPYAEIVAQARAYIEKIGGFEQFATWGLY